MNGRGLVVEKQVQVLNESLISLQKEVGTSPIKGRSTNGKVYQLQCMPNVSHIGPCSDQLS
jgi:hypothetical protein